MLAALKKLGEKLTPTEIVFLQQNSNEALINFEKVTGNVDDKVWKIAGNEVKQSES